MSIACAASTTPCWSASAPCSPTIRGSPRASPAAAIRSGSSSTARCARRPLARARPRSPRGSSRPPMRADRAARARDRARPAPRSGGSRCVRAACRSITWRARWPSRASRACSSRAVARSTPRCCAPGSPTSCVLYIAADDRRRSGPELGRRGRGRVAGRGARISFQRAAGANRRGSPASRRFARVSSARETRAPARRPGRMSSARPHRRALPGHRRLRADRPGVRIAGRIQSLEVKAGTAVKKGQVVARLDDALDKATRDVRAHGLDAAKADLALLHAGSRVEDIRAARAELDAAQANEDVIGKEAAREKHLLDTGATTGSRLNEIQAQLAASGESPGQAAEARRARPRRSCRGDRAARCPRRRGRGRRGRRRPPAREARARGAIDGGRPGRRRRRRRRRTCTPSPDVLVR